MFPAIDLEVAYRWAGTFGETEDGLAYIGQIRQMPRCYFALGFGGNGITYSMIAADIIRDAILKRPNANARLFRFKSMIEVDRRYRAGRREGKPRPIREET